MKQEINKLIEVKNGDAWDTGYDSDKNIDLNKMTHDTYYKN